MLNAVYAKFIRGLRWNALESIWYQVALAGHQLMLFSLTPTSTFGFIGTVFSTLYLILTVTNFGLDSSLGTFFSSISSSKQAFRRIVLPQLLPELFILCVLALLFIALRSFLIPHVPATMHLDNLLVGALSMLLLSEGLKKTFKTLLQLAFYNTVTATIEIITITIYVGTVWTIYSSGYPITLELIFFPMLITSCINTAVLAGAVYLWYATLPEVSANPVPPLAGRILQNRFFNYVTHLSHTLFSGNFLVPLFAVQCGLASAGIFKLVSTIAYTLSCILQKIFGLTTEALLAHVKPLHLDHKQDAFKKITYYLYPAVYTVLFCVCLNASKIVTFAGASAHSTLPLIILFFMIHFSEYFFMAYEKFFIIEEKNKYLFIINVGIIALMYVALSHAHTVSAFTILSTLLGVRILAFVVISSLAFYRWQLVPGWRIQPQYLALIALACLLFFIW